MEPTGGSPSGESGEDRSLDNIVINHSHSQNKRARRKIRKSTDQKRTDLSELPDTSSPRDGTTRSVLTKSSCASVDETIALVLKGTSQKFSLDQQQARGCAAHIRVPNFDGLHLEASRSQLVSQENETANSTLSHEPVIRKFPSPEPGVLSQNTRDVTGPEWPL
jgi:hypothetical protein